MQYFGRLAGLITLAVALIPIATNQALEARRALFGRESLDVISVTHPGEIWFQNTGDWDLLVTDARIRTIDSDPYVRLAQDEVRSIGMRVPRSEFAVAERKTRSLNADGEWLMVHSVYQAWQPLSPEDRGRCVRFVFYGSDDSALVPVREILGDALNSWPAEAQITYIGRHGESVLTVPLTGVLFANRLCRQILEDAGVRAMWDRETAIEYQWPPDTGEDRP